MKTNYQPNLNRDLDYSATAGAVAGTSQIAAAAIGAMAQNKLNDKTMDYNKEMYKRQRDDAIMDREFTNTYNSPTNQMQRLQAAGLNPNLVYGNGNIQMGSAPTRPSTPGSWNPKAADYSGIAQGVGNALSVQLQQRQLANMDAQTQLIQAQTAKTSADTANSMATNPGISIDNDAKAFDLQFKKDMKDLTMATTAQQLAGLVQGYDYALTANEQKIALSNLDLKAKAEQVVQARFQNSTNSLEKQKLQAQLQQIQTSTDLDKQDLQLKKLGIEPHDNIIARIIGKLIGPSNINTQVNKDYQREKGHQGWPDDLPSPPEKP